MQIATMVPRLATFYQIVMIPLQNNQRKRTKLSQNQLIILAVGKKEYGTMEREDLGSNATLATYSLGDLGQV